MDTHYCEICQQTLTVDNFELFKSNSSRQYKNKSYRNKCNKCRYNIRREYLIEYGKQYHKDHPEKRMTKEHKEKNKISCQRSYIKRRYKQLIKSGDESALRLFLSSETYLRHSDLNLNFPSVVECVQS